MFLRFFLQKIKPNRDWILKNPGYIHGDTEERPRPGIENINPVELIAFKPLSDFDWTLNNPGYIHGDTELRARPGIENTNPVELIAFKPLRDF